MASLLDMYVQQNPMLGGLLGPQGPAPAQGVPAPQMQQTPPGILPQAGGPQGAPQQELPGTEAHRAPAERPPQMQSLEDVFDAAGRAVQPLRGQEMSRLDKRETLLQTGLQLLGGGGQTTLAEALARGIFAGRQAAAQNNALRQAELEAQERAQRYMAVFGDGPMTTERIEQAIQVATIQGDKDAMDVWKDVRDQVSDEESEALGRTPWTDPETGELYFTSEHGGLWDVRGEQVFESPKYTPKRETTLTTMDVDGVKKKVLVDMQDGSFEVVGDDYTEPIDPYSGSFVKDIMVGGVPHSVLFSKSGQRIRDLGEAKSTQAQGDITAMGRRNALIAELDNVRRLVGDDYSGVPGPIKARFPRMFQSAQQQQLADASGAIGQIVLQLRSGATATEQEFGRIMQANLPVPGDHPEAIAAKYIRLERIIDEFGTGGLDAVMKYDDSDTPVNTTGAISALDSLGGR